MLPHAGRLPPRSTEDAETPSRPLRKRTQPCISSSSCRLSLHGTQLCTLSIRACQWARKTTAQHPRRTKPKAPAQPVLLCRRLKRKPLSPSASRALIKVCVVSRDNSDSPSTQHKRISALLLLALAHKPLLGFTFQPPQTPPQLHSDGLSNAAHCPYTEPAPCAMRTTLRSVCRRGTHPRWWGQPRRRRRSAAVHQRPPPACRPRPGSRPPARRPRLHA